MKSTGSRRLGEEESSDTLEEEKCRWLRGEKVTSFLDCVGAHLLGLTRGEVYVTK